MKGKRGQVLEYSSTESKMLKFTMRGWRDNLLSKLSAAHTHKNLSLDRKHTQKNQV